MVSRLAKEYQGLVEFRRMNVENDENAARLARDYKVQYVPTFVFVNADGTEAATLVGEVTERALRDELDALQ